MNKTKKIQVLTNITEDDYEQEEFGSSQSSKKNQIIDVELSKIETQLNENIIPLIKKLDIPNNGNNTTLQISKITLKVGFSLEGKIFIASSKIDSAIELEFTKGNAK